MSKFFLFTSNSNYYYDAEDTRHFRSPAHYFKEVKGPAMPDYSPQCLVFSKEDFLWAGLFVLAITRVKEINDLTLVIWLQGYDS